MILSSDIWKDIKDYEGFYQISDKGVIKSLHRFVSCKDDTIKEVKETIINTGNNGNGYLFVYLWKNNKCKRYYVHRLVAKHFIPNPNNYLEINHKDRNKANNNVSNLEWCNSKQNKEHAIAIKIIRNDGIVYNSIKDAANKNNILPATLSHRLNNNYYIKHKTDISFKYYHDCPI